MQTLALAGQINSVDAPANASQATLNVDLRTQPTAGGFFTAEIKATDIAAATTTIPAQLSVIDGEGGGAQSVLNVDFRQQATAGGFFEAEVATALLSYAGAAAPATPTTTTVASGALTGETDLIKTTYVDANGNESLASAEKSQAVASSHVAKVTSPAASTGAVSYNVYATNGATGTETLQNATPIALATDWQEPDTGLTTTGRAVPTANKFATGACSVIVAKGGSLATGTCTVTVQQ